MADGGTSAQSLDQYNVRARNALLATAIPQSKDLTTFVAPGLGQTSRIQLFNAGIITKLVMLLTCPVTVQNAPVTLSPRAPYNLISRIRVTDFANNDRMNLSGFQLFVLNCVRNRTAFGWNNDGSQFNANGSTELGGSIVNPAIGTLVGNQTIQFWLELPVAFDPLADLRGGIYAQTGVGQLWLTIDWAPALFGLANIDALYNGPNGAGAVMQGAVTGPSINVFQEFYMPQPVPGMGFPQDIPLPPLDLATVYEFNGNLRSTDNLAQNADKLIPYPNYRTVIGAYVNFVNQGAMAANDLNKMKIIANGNNILREVTQVLKILQQRNYTNGDISTGGTYYFLHREKPIETALFGNVQLAINPNVIPGGVFFVEQGFESFYRMGASLPGMNAG